MKQANQTCTYDKILVINLYVYYQVGDRVSTLVSLSLNSVSVCAYQDAPSQTALDSQKHCYAKIPQGSLSHVYDLDYRIVFSSRSRESELSSVCRAGVE